MDCHLAYCYGNRRRCDYNMSRCIQSFPRVAYNSTRSLILLYMALCTLLLLKASSELFLNDDSLKCQNLLSSLWMRSWRMQCSFVLFRSGILGITSTCKGTSHCMRRKRRKKKRCIRMSPIHTITKGRLTPDSQVHAHIAYANALSSICVPPISPSTFFVYYGQLLLCRATA